MTESAVVDLLNRPFARCEFGAAFRRDGLRGKMASRLPWEQFTFFDKHNIHENVAALIVCVLAAFFIPAVFSLEEIHGLHAVIWWIDVLRAGGNRQGAPVTCATAEGGLLIFGDNNGRLTIADRNCVVSSQHTVFKGKVFGVEYIVDKGNQARQFIITIGEEQVARTDRLESKHAEGSTSLQLVVKVFNVHQMKRQIQAFQVPIVAADATLTAFEVLEDGTQIALGFNTGLVLLFKGDFLREGAMGRSVQPTMLHQSHSHPVSGLQFKYTISGADRAVRLFVVFDKDAGQAPSEPVLPASVATAGILVFDTSVRTENRKPPVVLDERGAAPHCSALMKETGELWVGRYDGVFAYSSEDRGGAAGFEGPKQCVATIGRYILVAAPGVGKAGDRTVVTVYDFRNKITPYSKPLPAGDTVQFVLVDGDVAYIVTSRWSMLRLKEKDTASKVAVLLTKSNYPQAISLAMEEQWDVTERVNLFKQYGDYLLKTADYEHAIRQYSATIGYVPSSYVIRKFLDTQRMNHLTFYLEKLHEAGAATSEHTTLLLTCYTRMKNDEMLEKFISEGDGAAGNVQSNSTDSNDSASKKTSSALPKVSGAALCPAFGFVYDFVSRTVLLLRCWVPQSRYIFDVEVALSTLQDAGYADYGMRLARTHKEHDWYLRIQLNRPQPDYDDALQYLTQLACKLPLDEVVPYILRYGRKILEHKTLDFVNLLSNICTGQVSPQELGVYNFEQKPRRATDEQQRPQTPTSPMSPSSPTSPQAPRRQYPAPEDFIPVFTDHPHLLRTLLEDVYHAQRVPISTKMTNTLLELLLEEWSSKQQELAALMEAPQQRPPQSSDPLMNAQSAKVEQKSVTHQAEEDMQRIQELQLAVAKAEEKIMNLLTQPRPNYTEAHVLLLVQVPIAAASLSRAWSIDSRCGFWRRHNRCTDSSQASCCCWIDCRVSSFCCDATSRLATTARF